jgi:hypothetical protein
MCECAMCNVQMRNVMKNRGFGSTGVRGLGKSSHVAVFARSCHPVVPIPPEIHSYPESNVQTTKLSSVFAPTRPSQDGDRFQVQPYKPRYHAGYDRCQDADSPLHADRYKRSVPLPIPVPPPVLLASHS